MFGSDSNDKEYTFEERQLIMMGMGMGMGVLASIYSIPDQTMKEVVALIRASMHDIAPSMDCSNKELEQMKTKPSRRWSEDFNQVMISALKKVDAEFKRTGDKILDNLDKDIVDFDKNDPEEVMAVDGLKAMKDWLTSKGYTDIGTTDKLLATFQSLSPQERKELSEVMMKFVTKEHGGVADLSDRSFF